MPSSVKVMYKVIGKDTLHPHAQTLSISAATIKIKDIELRSNDMKLDLCMSFTSTLLLCYITSHLFIYCNQTVIIPLQYLTPFFFSMQMFLLRHGSVKSNT